MQSYLKLVSMFVFYLHILKINLEHQFIYICFPWLVNPLNQFSEMNAKSIKKVQESCDKTWAAVSLQWDDGSHPLTLAKTQKWN